MPASSSKARINAPQDHTRPTCPVVAKAMDLYIRDMNLDTWNQDQADTQFQAGSQSLFAFDVVLRELLIKNLFNINNSSEWSLTPLPKQQAWEPTNLLGLGWAGQLIGLILNEQGLKQGGINSSDLYKVFDKKQLTDAQKSGLGLKLGNVTIGCVGQTDDTGLVTNDIHKLFYLLELPKISC
jgi:hypothetical protein